MKIFLSVVIGCLLFSAQSFAQLYATQSGETSFFSETPIENITATSKTVGAIINTQTGEIAVSMKITSFDFPNKLMQEHFNENYLESTKFPTATFKGKIQETIDYRKNGTYNVTTKGILTVHGVAQNREFKGKIVIDALKVTLTSEFDVKLVDHNIEIPKLVFAKIAEVIKVRSSYNLVPYNKK
ncbi:YceI family protein [Flectobacillus major]|uniref:YceI family protein n=1 Tax=Flectobacillus major TaxID=103 RepID=UPI0005C6FFED|nr:YceI family protein [Flectobacillus major]